MKVYKKGLIISTIFFVIRKFSFIKDLTVAILIVLRLLLSISWIIKLITVIYYEKKQKDNYIKVK